LVQAWKNTQAGGTSLSGRERKAWLNVGIGQLVHYGGITGVPAARTGALTPTPPGSGY